MLNFAATVVDHAITRIILGLLGIVVTAVFGIWAVAFLIVNPLEEPRTFLFGLSASLGLIGWWARILMRSACLAPRPWFRAAICACLISGIGVAGYTLSMVKADIPAYPLLASMVGAGVLMLMGTIAISRSGPNKSFKPRPLRGSA